MATVASDHRQMLDVWSDSPPSDVPAGEAMIRTGLANAWAAMWSWPFFRALVAFDAVIVAGTTAILSYCFFAGKIGLLK